MPIEKLADPEQIRDKPGGKITDPEAQREAERCAKERADAILKVQGARARSNLYSPEIIAELSYGVLGLMLADILNGTITPKDAKQAIEIARAALQINDKIIGSGADLAEKVGQQTPATRADAIAKATELMTELRKRGTAQMDGQRASAGLDDVDLDQFDLDDEDRPPTHLRVVESPQSA